MRIGIDMLAVQSPLRAASGIGRFGRLLVASLLARGDGHEYVLYAHDDLPGDRIPAAPKAAIRSLAAGSGAEGSGPTHRLDRVVRANPDRLDALVVLDPFAAWGHYHPPCRPTRGVRLAALVHGLERFRFQDPIVGDPERLRDYRRLDALKGYDLLLATSDAARDDLLTLLGLEPDRVAVIGASADGDLFGPDPGAPALRLAVGSLAIARPFVVFGGGAEDRGPLVALLDALERIPSMRAGRRPVLVVVDTEAEWSDAELDDLSRARGLDRDLVILRDLDARSLRALYQPGALYLAPVNGRNPLPTLEAMRCGAVPIADRSGACAGLVGDSGPITDANDPGALAESIAMLLADPSLARAYSARAVARARTFAPEDVAARASDALARLEGRATARRLRVDRARPARPRIAFFSPLPPKKSGIADYSARLIAELSHHYEIDLYHDSGYVPEAALASDAVFACDARLFGRYASGRDYRGIVHQMGNSIYHAFHYDWLIRVPGIVTLHDFTLAGFHLARGKLRGRERSLLREELLRWHPEDASEVVAVMDRWDGDWEAMAETCARRGWALNRPVLDASRRVIVHSPWCVDRVRAGTPQYAEKMTVIPMGADPIDASDAEKAAIRARFGLAPGALVVASFGFVGGAKLLHEAAVAFASLAESDPSALFLIAGEDGDGGLTRRAIQSTARADRVRFLGRQSPGDFRDLMAVADLGINLRRPPTNGETSAALLGMLASGLPTIVTDVATFAEFPDAAVRKVRWESDGIDGLRRAMLDLARDPEARRALGRRARSHARETHGWPRVAALYARVIEECHRERIGDAVPA